MSKLLQKNIIKLFTCVLIIFAISVVGGCNSSKESNSKETSEENGQNLVTLQDYNQLKKGMTYEEVIKITGFEGKSFGDDKNNANIVWEGVAPESFISVSFKNGKLSTKMQHNLK